MKAFIKTILFLLLCIRCSSPAPSNTEELPNDHPFRYFELGKEKRSLKERLCYLTEAEKKATILGLDSIVIKSLSFKAYLFKENRYKDERYLDSVLPVSKKMLKAAIKAKDSANIGKAYFKIGENFLNKNINDSAFYYFDKSKYIYASIKDSSQTGKKIDRMARILIDDSNYNLAESLLVEALEYLEPIKDSVSLTSVYLNLAIKYKEQANYNKAKSFINKAYEYSCSPKANKVIKNTELLILQKNGDFDALIKKYSKLINDKDIINNKKEYARILDNFTYTKWLAGYNENIESKLQESLHIRDSLQDVSGLIASYEHLMRFYSKKNASKATLYAKKLFKLTVAQNNLTDRLDAIEYLKTSLPNESMQYTRLELELKDSLLNAQKLSGYQYAAMIYDTNNLEKKLFKEQKEKELVNQKRITQNIIYGGSGLLILISSIFLLFYLQTKHRKEKIQERHSTEKRISKKIHDEVGNDIFYLATQLQQDPDFTTDPDKLKILKGFDSVYHKVRDISRDHTVETGEEYGDEVLSLLNSYGSQTTKVITNTVDVDFWSSVSAYKKGELYWVLKELLTNMKKHSKASFVSVQFLKEKQHLVVTYVDNGIGINDTHLISKNGLRNVENRMKDIKGTITFESEPKQGFKAKIVFTS
ncbi:tetratricopeptide repeat-containing sensor histidine kinase [Aquimarina sp. AU58]|uniref:ATP-binding protein n=1 Tax=Aquimarina sp. AU58 TaxID=1874112 RepID=UPI000D6E8277|nr:tetratricopeptide repeat-containing sensor histidine kinase [Aquimarina sp. AU58]